MLFRSFEYLDKVDMHTDSQNRIMDAAIYLFAKNSYKNTSTKSIALKANVSEALIFKKFGNKHNLLHEVIKIILDDYLPGMLNAFFDELLASQVTPQNTEDIKNLLLGKASYMNNRLGYVKILIFEINELDNNLLLEIRAMVNNIFDKASLLIQTLKNNNIIKVDLDNRLLIRSFISMVNFMIIDLNFLSDEANFEEKFNREFEQIINLFFKGASNE